MTHAATKPFNPMLSETFEFVTDDFEYLAEQVTHHPPVTACEYVVVVYIPNFIVTFL